MNRGAPPSWPRRILGVIVGVLLLAVGARVVYELLAPLIPWLVIIGLLVVLSMMGSHRRERQ